MSFPSPSLAPPALATWQFSYLGLKFGGIDRTQTYQLQSMPTSGMPDVSAADIQRALEQGEFQGVDVLPGRDIQISQVVNGGFVPGQAPTLAQQQAVDAAVQNLGAVMQVAGSTEQPLWWQLPSGLFATMVKPRKHACPVDINRIMAGAVVATSLLHGSDPRWYLAPSKQSAAVGLPTPAGGLTFPATANFTFGGGGVGGLVTVSNNGPFETRPILVINGPGTNPVISNLSISGNPWIGVSIVLNAGDTLVIDTDFRSVLYTASGTTASTSRRNAVMSGSTWWNLPAKSSCTIEFTTTDAMPVAGTLAVQSADGYLTI